MKTRRSKGNDTGEEAAQDEASFEMDIDIPDEIDISQLSGLVPDKNLLKPDAQTIIILYRLVLDQRQDISTLNVQLDEARSNSMKKEVELDQTIQEHDVKFKELEEAVSEKTTELSRMKQERDTLSAAKASLEQERASLDKSRNVTTSEVETLKFKLADHEREKRDLIGVIARLRSDDEEREAEVKTLRDNLKTVRKDYQDVQSQLSDARSYETTAKFKLQYLEQQVELAQTTADSTNAELAQKSDEFAQYRREKQAEIVSLSSSLDSLKAQHSATEANLKARHKNYEDQSTQLARVLRELSHTEEQLFVQTASYRSEATNQARLIELLESRNKQAQARVEEVESEWEQMVKAAGEREEKLMGEIGKEKARAERLEGIVEELQNQRENEGEGSVIGFNEHGTPGGPGTPAQERAVFSLSPAAGVAARLQKTGKSFTEVYADYVKLNEELTKSHTEKRRLEELLSQVLADLEERTPLLAQQRQEFERTKQEANQLADQLGQTISERDYFKLRSADLDKQLQSGKHLIEELEQSASDLGRQIQHLLRQIAVMENPSLDTTPILPSAPSAALSADLALGSDEVVLFQNLASLQSQNQMLLKVAHSSALALDRKEQEFLASSEKEDSEAVREANEAIAVLEEQLQDQARSQQIKLAACLRELDFYKSSASKSTLPSVSINGDSGAISDTGLLHSELRTQFDSYRVETEVDVARLREELNILQREANKAGADLAKANGTIQYLNERHRMQNDANQLKDRELSDITQRCQDLRDQCTRLELAYTQAAENLSQAHGNVERLRNESANLRAEKLIWKDVESRLASENLALSKEKSQLADLVGNVQKMHEDLDRANDHDRKRQESQLQAQESQVQDLRAQLIHEREALRALSVQKDIEFRDLHERLDRSVKDHGSAAQALAVSDARQKHLEERIEDILKQSEAQKEKLSVYERRPSAAHSGDITLDTATHSQFEAEVAQLRADLKTTQIELLHAQEHAEQYKGISESNEQAFQQLTTTFDEMQKSSQIQLQEKDTELRRLLDRAALLQEEISSATLKQNELQKVLETERLAFKQEQQSLELKIIDMTTSAANYYSDNTNRDSELKEQEQRAQNAERKYEDAIKAHAEAINALDKLKEKLSDASARARDSGTNADTAISQLRSSETSWNNQRLLLEKEVADVNKRAQELTEQNELLHHQLETLGAQASRIRQTAASTAEVSMEETQGQPDQQLADLRSVISYLRKEKEILDLQLEVAKQEAARCKAEVAHLSRVLDENKRILSEERERAAQSATSAAEHAELVERITQLNLLRESNATLRAEASANKSRVAQLEEENAKLMTDLEPMRRQLRVMEAEMESKDVQAEHLKREAAHWQERNHQILSKYDRADPAEIQQVKEQLETASKRVEELELQNQEMQKQAEAQADLTEKAKKNLQAHRDMIAKIRTQSKALRDESEQQKLQLNSQIETLTTERDSLQLRNDAELLQEASQLRDEIQSLQKQSADLKQELDRVKRLPATESGQPTAQALETALSERDALAAAKIDLETRLQAVAAGSGSTEALGNDEKTALLAAKQLAESQAAEAKTKQTAGEELIKQWRGRMQTITKDLQTAKLRIATLEKELGESQTARTALENLSREQKEKLEVAAAEAKGQAVSTAETFEVSASHPRDLKELEDRLNAEHERAVEALKLSLPESSDSSLQKAEIERLSSLLAAANSELEKLRADLDALRKEKEEALNQGLEQGRKEMATKIKLKDSQMSRTNKRLQEVEQALVKATDGAYKPAGPKATGPINTTNNTSQPSLASPAVENIANPGTSVAGAATPEVTTTAATSTTTSRGRGVALRGAAVRGRGGARGGATSASAVTPPSAAGTSILGAAGKREREGEPDPSADTQPKRLKSAGPVSINRNRPLPPETS